MTHRFFSFLLVFLITCCTNGSIESDAQTAVTLEPAFPSLSFDTPVDLQHAGDGTNRLYVVEQEGVIRIFENVENASQAGVFLDIRDRVLFGGEQGLLGLAFHPDYAQNSYFYVNYTTDNPRRTRISRFEVDAGDRTKAAPGRERVILEFEQPYPNHNGGQVAFGPDGYLYIATGDGGSGGDPHNNGQNRATLLGKILRIDVDRTSGNRAYAIPADNPFARNTDGSREEIFAYGLRNPWRFSFDPVTGQLWTGDVGQNRLEEVDIVEKGGNYGWRIREGSDCYEPRTGCSSSGLIPPVAEYGRNEGMSVTGGYVYRGKDVPALTGAYVYGDYVTGRIWTVRMEGGKGINDLLLDTSYPISSFGVDARGELYVVSHSGKLYRFRSTSAGTN